MPYKLPIVATIAEAYGFLIRRLGAWFQIAIAPLVIWVGLTFAIARGWLGGLTLGLGSEAPMIAYALLNAPFFLAYLLIAASLLLYAVALHRIVLDTDDAGGLGRLVWRARHWRYAGYGVVVVAIMGLGFIVTATFVPAIGTVAGTAGVLESAAGQVTLTVIVLILFAVPTALLTCMVLPALPAAAANDRAVTLAEASNQAHGNLWRMTIIFAFAGLLPMWLIETAVSSLTHRALTDGAPVFVAGTAQILVNFVGFTVLVVLLSAIYRRLRENVPLRSEMPPR